MMCVEVLFDFFEFVQFFSKKSLNLQQLVSKFSEQYDILHPKKGW